VLSQADKVVYVDSGSTDGSVELAQSLGVRVLSLGEGPFTAARGRQVGSDWILEHWAGIRHIQYLDGDCVLQPEWLRIGREKLESTPTVGAVFGRRREENCDGSLFSRLVDIDWRTPLGSNLHFTGDGLVRVSALQEVSGWSVELIAGEDPDLGFRLIDQGWTVDCLDAEMSQHDIRMRSFRPYFKRAVRSGFAYAQVGWRHRSGVGRVWLKTCAGNLVYGLVLPLVALIALAALWAPVLMTWQYAVGALVVIAAVYVRLFWAMMRFCRSRGAGWSLAVTYAALNVFNKAACALGTAKWLVLAARRRRPQLIEYR